MRADLVSALCAVSGSVSESKVYRFLDGLSKDELAFIAEYAGSCILESSTGQGCCVNEFQRIKELRGGDPSHKVILLVEYLNLAAPALPKSSSARAAQG